jgi:hypothetical protein
MTPTIAIVVVIAIFCVIGLFLLLQRLVKPRKVVQPYVLRPSLFTPAERSFLGCLDSILPSDIRVFAKVRLADLFSVEKTVDRSAWQSAFNKINSKHVDFILYRANDLSPLLAIELDDRTHDREDRQQRDVFLEGIFEASSLPLLRIKVQKAYKAEDIAKRVNDALA